MLQTQIITLFPEMVASVLATSILSRAAEGGQFQCDLISLREHGLGRYRRVDDSPYGGGPGMLLRPEPVFAALEQALTAAPDARLLLPSPQGRHFDQALAQELAEESRPLVILCGHYEGFDARVLEAFPLEEISAGDVVLTGGELPALMMLDATVRLLPGVLGNEQSSAMDSFSAGAEGLLKHPQYTRPAEFRGMQVPEVLLSGNHREIDRWRAAQTVQNTKNKRPDLMGDRHPTRDT